jgi:tRNA(Ile)-lysidine synthase
VREKVLRYIREQGLLRAGDRVAAAVSGGADSVALLRVLIDLDGELGIVLAVAHFNHGLRGEASDGDEAFVAELAKAQGLEFCVARGDVRDYASASGLSIEAAGRELRYEWFAQLAREQRFDRIATAHTCDDQAETALLKFLRGAATRGLAGIYPIKTLAAEARPVCVVRPLLPISRSEVETYLSGIGQSWREDESNLDRRFVRNRVRHELLPLLEREYNPNLRRLLADMAEVARGEEEYWRELVGREASARTSAGRFSVAGFAELPVALQRRLLKRWVEDAGIGADFEHIEKLRHCALGERLRAELPGGHIARREASALELRGPAREPVPAYQYVLPIPGEVQIAELGRTVRATVLAEEFARETATEKLLDAELVGAELRVRNWCAGDRYWPAHSRAEEKLKRLFAEKHVPAEQRASWPVALHDSEIVWVTDFPVAHSHQWRGQGAAVMIELEQGCKSEGKSIRSGS